jgi:phosphosulfolactate synthase
MPNYNVTLPFLPERTVRPRNSGITMVMDKGISLRQAEDFVESYADYVDFVKLGFGTSVVSKNVKEKIKLYKNAGIKTYLGGTFFEACIARGKFDEYQKFIDTYGLDAAEVSDGSIEMAHDSKCDYIRKLAKNFTVLSEVGSKEEGIIIHPAKWVSMMKAELEAGSFKVIAEARESGNVGLYRDSGEVRQGLVDEILTQIPAETIIWEAPQKAQQVWFIKLIGSNINLGNIAPADVIPVETLRLGLRSDTFDHFLDMEVK